jgi:hypothetical protein
MSRRNGRARQARLQRKRNKRAAGRAEKRSSGAREQGPPQEMLVLGAVLCCQTLLAGESLEGESLGMARLVREDLGGVLGRIPLELQGFLFADKDWTLTCKELEPLRELFDEHDAEGAFERLWSLALTLESDPKVFHEDIFLQECAHRAASAFEQLTGSLDDRKRSPAAALRALTLEAERHGASSSLRKSYEKMLRAAVGAVHAAAAKLPQQLGKLRTEVAAVFEMGPREEAEEAYWECARVFLREVLRRLQSVPGAVGSPAYTELARRLLPAPQAAVELARSGQPGPLAAVHLGPTAGPWRAFLEKELDVGVLPFDARVRYEIVRLKLLRTQAMSADDGGATVRETLAAFQGLQNMLLRGVPPAARDIPAALAAPLLDFYVDTLESLHCEAEGLRLTEELLCAQPEDFRLACLYATGAIARGEHFRLTVLAKHPPVRHLAPELFARSVRKWSRAPGGMKAVAGLRERLFEPLDREGRKQCLIALARQCLRQATSLAEYNEGLTRVLPFFPKDSFVLGELRAQTALESSLVFLATMLAPLHTLKLTLTDEQSQQWVSHAREIARQSPLGSEVVQHHLKSPTKWFTLAPAVLAAARAQLSEFAPRPAPAAPPPEPPKPKKRRKRKEKDSSPQPGLFDALDP